MQAGQSSCAFYCILNIDVSADVASLIPAWPAASIEMPATRFFLCIQPLHAVGCYVGAKLLDARGRTGCNCKPGTPQMTSIASCMETLTPSQCSAFCSSDSSLWIRTSNRWRKELQQKLRISAPFLHCSGSFQSGLLWDRPSTLCSTILAYCDHFNGCLAFPP